MSIGTRAAKKRPAGSRAATAMPSMSSPRRSLSGTDTSPGKRSGDLAAKAEPGPGAQELFTIKEAATFLKVGVNKMYELVNQGLVPSIRLMGQHRVPRAQL